MDAGYLRIGLPRWCALHGLTPFMSDFDYFSPLSVTSFQRICPRQPPPAPNSATPSISLGVPPRTTYTRSSDVPPPCMSWINHNDVGCVRGGSSCRNSPWEIRFRNPAKQTRYVVVVFISGEEWVAAELYPSAIFDTTRRYRSGH